MLSEDAKKTIDALPKEELLQEINKKNRSRFQDDKYAYLQTRLEAITQQGQQEQRQEDVIHKKEELSLAREANQLSQKANKFSKIAIAVSIIAALIALGGLIADVWSNGKPSAP